ncbi:hypothetical protein BJY52DRAFT_1221403 [Lactarius psammicola]|nr:hypothetical protein BJY52DRAFT_1221403 [Lactarius psammicola]
MKRVQQFWPDGPTKDRLHVCVVLPSGKRKAEDEPEHGKSPNLVRTELYKLHELSTSGLSSIAPDVLQAAWVLYTVMWDKPLRDVVETGVLGQKEDEFKYVPFAQLKRPNLSIWFGFNEKVLLFRQEYLTAFDSLDMGSSMKRKDSVVVAGHPGIGMGFPLIMAISNSS